MIAPAPDPVPAERGFTLMEALVALAILSVASAGLLGAIQAHVDRVRGLELRAGALWVAQDALARLSLGLPDETPPMLGHRWRVEVTRAATADPDVQAVTVSVGDAAGGGTLTRLRGFAGRGTTAP